LRNRRCSACELLTDFHHLKEQDIREALAFGARLAQGHEIRLDVNLTHDTPAI
jgi:uncharacterized protein (DUF433 family)